MQTGVINPLSGLRKTVFVRGEVAASIGDGIQLRLGWNDNGLQEGEDGQVGGRLVGQPSS